MADIHSYDSSAAGREALSELFRESFPFGSHMSAEYVEWSYEQNPDGRSIAQNAYVNGRLAAHFAVTAFRSRFLGEPELGVQIQHAATRPEYRGRRLFPELVEHTLRLARDAGYGFALGTPNRISTRPFVERLGFQFVSPLDVLVGVGRAPARRTVPGAEIEFARVYSAEALAWRLARPDSPYAAQRDARTTRVFSAQGVRGIPVELGTYPTADVPPSVPDAAPRHPLRAWIGLDPQRSWRGQPYLPLPMRLRPAPLNLVFRDLSERNRCPRPDRVQLDMLDFDGF